MRILLAVLLIAPVLSVAPGQNNAHQSPGQRSPVKQPISKEFTFQPIHPPRDAVVRQQRQQPPGYQYNSQPNPSFFLPSAQSTVLPIVPTPAPVRPVTIPAFATPPRPVPTLPSVSYIPPVTTSRPAPPPPPPPPAPTPVRPVPPPPTPVRPVPPPPPPPAPVTFAPPPIVPVTFPTPPPVTFAPPVIEPIRPVPIPEPVISEPTAVNPMALMPQLPTQQMPQIVLLDATCAKDSMVVRIRFDTVFNGLIYSKGFHNSPECNYVRVNTGRDAYEFTIRLDSCGSQWVDQLSSGGQAYLENIIIIQNEAGIQEIWDTARTLRCLWEGSLEKTVTYVLNVDMLDSQIVSFSGDTATAVMDVQIGKGPSAPSANGLVKIGETLTMVIFIEGDPGFDVHVQDCIAHDGDRANAVTLTDSRGCVLKKKLMGPWQKTRQTAGIRQGVSLIAYSFFQAFKFPDTMDVFLECNVELCKNGCDICPEDAALFGRKRRSLPDYNNATVSDVRLSRRVRVISNEDISLTPDGRSSVTLTTGNRRTSQEDVCMTMSSFIVGLIVILVILVISCIMTALLCIKVRSIPGDESIYPPSSFHAFSSSASKA